MIKSEFDPYLDLTFAKLGDGIYWCYEQQKLIKQQSMTDTIDRVKNLAEQDEIIASEIIFSDSLELLERANKITSNLESICAKLELAFIPYEWN